MLFVQQMVNVAFDLQKGLMNEFKGVLHSFKKWFTFNWFTHNIGS